MEAVARIEKIAGGWEAAAASPRSARVDLHTTGLATR